MAEIATEDTLEIHELVTRYNFAIDRGDVETYLDCFTEDGAFDGVLGRYEGREELRRFAVDLAEGPGGAPFRPMRHWTTNFVIEPEGGPDAARMRSDHLLVRPEAGGGVKLLVLATYADRLRRVGGRWLFAERKITLLGGRPE